MTKAYGRRYFGKIGLPPSLLILHYVLFGERRGAWANPFFDPAAVREGMVPPLAEYLASADAGRFQPSPNFDAGWYKRRMPPDCELNPLVHFWTVGFDQNLNPSPHFDCAFFKSVVACTIVDKRRHAFERLASAAPSDPIDEADLIARQKRFWASVEIETLKRSSKPLRRYLVFIQASRDTPFPFLDETRSFDVLVNYYDQAPDALSDAEHSFFQRGTKTTAIAKLFETNPDLLLSYAAVMFLDDDVQISSADVDDLFAAFERESLDLAQPALTADSATHFPDLKQPTAGSGIRYLTAVEIMAPVVSRRALKACQWVFRESISGWGVDVLLAAEVKRLFCANSIALVADVVATHTRPVDVAEGAFYKFLSSFGLIPHHEMGRIAWHHGVTIDWPAIRFADTDPRRIKDRTG